MSCFDKIAAAITNDCENVPKGALEVKAWAASRADKAYTLTDNKYALDAPTSSWYAVTVVKKELNSGFDLVTGDNIPNMFKHRIELQPYAKTAAAIKNLDQMDDIVVIVELKGPKVEGCFVVLGATTGLQLVESSWRANDNNGLPTYAFETRDGEGEPYSRISFWDTSYDDTLTALNARL